MPTEYVRLMGQGIARQSAVETRAFVDAWFTALTWPAAAYLDLIGRTHSILRLALVQPRQ
jgi:hypothetical protein